jgi:hypothetical protein
LKGRGFTGKTGTRGDQLVTLMIGVPAVDDPSMESLKTWSESARENLGNPRAGLGV